MIFIIHNQIVVYVQEASIEEYFKPIDKEAEMIMKIQLEGEEKTMKEMVATMQKQALLEKAEAEKIANTHQPDKNQDATYSSSQHAQMR